MNYMDILEKLNLEELELFEKDLKEGYIQKYIDQKKEFFKIKDKYCPVCGNNVKEDCFVLIWGEPSLRKKAHFCGIDCLKYFINNKINKKTSIINIKKNNKN
ncbi:MAG: hypothetical protein QXK76_00150 [Candidatus Woesearchaeota archaeon]